MVNSLPDHNMRKQLTQSRVYSLQCWNYQSELYISTIPSPGSFFFFFAFKHFWGKLRNAECLSFDSYLRGFVQNDFTSFIFYYISTVQYGFCCGYRTRQIKNRDTSQYSYTCSRAHWKTVSDLSQGSAATLPRGNFSFLDSFWYLFGDIFTIKWRLHLPYKNNYAN